MTEKAIDDGHEFEPLQRLTELIAEASATPQPDNLPDRLPLSSIAKEPVLFQPRSEISEKHLSDLVRAIEHFGELDPVEVIQVGSRAVVIDGHHRLEAYKIAKRVTDIPVRYFDGTVEDAVLAAGGANSKVKLPMSPQERQDFAWRLVLLGKRYSKDKISKASGVSTTQVALMRKAMKQLGESAFQFRSWFLARKQAAGDKPELDVEAWEQMKREKADWYADQMARMFSTKLAENPEVAAMALETYFGRRLPAVLAELKTGDEFDDGDVGPEGEKPDF